MTIQKVAELAAESRIDLFGCSFGRSRLYFRFGPGGTARNGITPGTGTQGHTKPRGGTGDHLRRQAADVPRLRYRVHFHRGRAGVLRDQGPLERAGPVSRVSSSPP